MIFIYLATLIIAILFFILYDGNISFMICAFTVLFPLALTAMSLIARVCIRAELRIDAQKCASGQAVPMKLIITNRSIIPVPMSEITIGYRMQAGSSEEKMKICTPIFPMNTQTLSAGFSSEHYGIAECRIRSVKIFDFLRITKFGVPKKNISQKTYSVTVMPEAVPLSNAVSSYSLLGADSSEFSQTKPGDDPSEVFGIREFADGDRLSRIHWKLSAKTDEIMVKDYSLPLAECCMILTDFYINGSDPYGYELYDTELQLSLSLSTYLSENEVRHRTAAYSELTGQLEQAVVFDEDTALESSVLMLSCGIGRDKDSSVFALSQNTDITQRFGHLIYICTEFTQAAADQLAASGLAHKYTALICCHESFAPNLPDTEIDMIPVYCGNITRSVEELVI